MELLELKKLIDYYIESDPSCGSAKVVILTEEDNVNQVGLSSVDLKTIDFGFDFDNGKCFIIPQEKLTPYLKKNNKKISLVKLL